MPETAELDDATSKLLAAHKDDVEQIVKLEGEADSLTGEADSYRAQAAGLIVKLIESGATERAVAGAIGKSDAHVHFAKVAWTMMQGDTTIDSFNTAYKMAKRPQRPTSTPSSSGAGEGDNPPDTEKSENPFPPWAQQLRELKRLTAEMVEQASLKQVKQLIKTLEKPLRAAVQKQEELEEAEGQSE